jgi:hypothetical protein
VSCIMDDYGFVKYKKLGQITKKPVAEFCVLA